MAEKNHIHYYWVFNEDGKEIQECVNCPKRIERTQVRYKPKYKGRGKKLGISGFDKVND